MKPPTVFLGEMTNPEVEEFLKTRHTVIVPTGATEQHGPHGPLLTDVLIPQEVARRAAPTIGALVAPPINYALSYPHVGFTGLVHIRISTFMSLIEDLCLSFATAGFKRIIFLNGHYDNTYAIAYGCANAAYKLPPDVKAFPLNYWDGFTAEDVAEWSGLENGLHANRAETSAVLAINPNLVDMARANAEFPPFPEYTVNTGPSTLPFSSRRQGRCSTRRSQARGVTRANQPPMLASVTCRPECDRRWQSLRTSRERLQRCLIGGQESGIGDQGSERPSAGRKTGGSKDRKSD